MAKAKAKSKAKTKKRTPKKTAGVPKQAATPLLLSEHAEHGTPATAATNLFRTAWARQLFVGVNVLFFLLFGLGIWNDIHELQQIQPTIQEGTVHDSKTYNQFRTLSHEVTQLRTEEAAAGDTTNASSGFEQELSSVQVEIQVGKYRQARTHMDQLQPKVDGARAALAMRAHPQQTAGTSVDVPILIYHETPGDFDNQLTALEQKGYTVIPLSRLAGALYRNQPLPPKPAVITFDDGFSNQMKAFEILKRHNMPATYYIITSGERSHWCIGAARRYNDPSQPAAGCGDSYMSWDQVKELDRSGLITIGAHTVDHQNLAAQNEAEQRFEINASKQDIEQHLGHTITDFAYPYGGFSATTISLVRQAGFTTAVSTLPGTTQTLASIYTLRRVRDPYMLP